MLIAINKETNKIELNKLLSNMESQKQFNSQKFAGKINWNEEPLQYQKNIRNEWN